MKKDLLLLKKSLKILSLLFLVSCSGFPKMNNYAINGEAKTLICNSHSMKDCKYLSALEADNYLAVSPEDLSTILTCDNSMKVIFLCAINGKEATLICFRESDSTVQNLTFLEANNYFSVHPGDYNKLLNYRIKKCEDKE